MFLLVEFLFQHEGSRTSPIDLALGEGSIEGRNSSRCSITFWVMAASCSEVRNTNVRNVSIASRSVTSVQVCTPRSVSTELTIKQHNVLMIGMPCFSSHRRSFYTIRDAAVTSWQHCVQSCVRAVWDRRDNSPKIGNLPHTPFDRCKRLSMFALKRSKLTSFVVPKKSCSDFSLCLFPSLWMQPLPTPSLPPSLSLSPVLNSLTA